MIFRRGRPGQTVNLTVQAVLVVFLLLRGNALASQRSLVLLDESSVAIAPTVEGSSQVVVEAIDLFAADAISMQWGRGIVGRSKRSSNRGLNPIPHGRIGKSNQVGFDCRLAQYPVFIGDRCNFVFFARPRNPSAWEFKPQFFKY